MISLNWTFVVKAISLGSCRRPIEFLTSSHPCLGPELICFCQKSKCVTCPRLPYKSIKSPLDLAKNASDLYLPSLMSISNLLLAGSFSTAHKITYFFYLVNTSFSLYFLKIYVIKTINLRYQHF